MLRSHEQVGDFIGISAYGSGVKLSVWFLPLSPPGSLISLGISGCADDCYIQQTKGSWGWGQPCALTVNASISIPQSHCELRDLQISTEILEIQFKPSLDLDADEVHLKTNCGSVNTVAAFGMKARLMAVVVGVGGITSDFRLYDQVKLFTGVFSCSPFTPYNPRLTLKA